MERGKYIVIEGHDGTGKSTHTSRLSERLYYQQGIESVEVYEPGDTPISEQIRTVIKNGDLERDGETNLLLFTASRRELWHQKIEPTLQAGKWVVSARNWYSSLAYQGYGEGVNLQKIETTTLKHVGSEYLRPDLGLVLVLNDETERSRRASTSADTHNDTFESRDAEFQANVAAAYPKIARRVGATAIEFTGKHSVKDVQKLIWQHVKKLL